MTYRVSDKTGELVGMMPVQDNHDVMLITSEGTIIRLHASDINVIGRATSGVTLMRTREDNMIVSCARTEREEEAPEAESEEAGDLQNAGETENSGES